MADEWVGGSIKAVEVEVVRMSSAGVVSVSTRGGRSRRARITRRVASASQFEVGRAANATFRGVLREL